MIQVCLDSSVYIQFLTQIDKNEFLSEAHDISNIVVQEIDILSRGEEVQFLLPEVVELELMKQNQIIKGEYSKHTAIIKESLKTLKFEWDQARELVSFLNEIASRYEKKKIEYWTDLYGQLNAFFNSGRITRIPLTPEIICATEKRKIAGEITNEQTQDSMIIESLHAYIDKRTDGDSSYIYFITQDNGFSKTRNGLTRSLKDKFEREHASARIIVVDGLKGFHHLINFDLPISENSAGVPDSIDLLDTPVDESITSSDLDDDEYWEKVAAAEKEFDQFLNAIFIDRISMFPDDIKSCRETVISDIYELLGKCRSTAAWDDRSELKLYEWLEGRSEDEIPRSKLSDLMLIRENLSEYYAIHRGMSETTE